MSNDQSPPGRKVIPYKKGGPRKSPFADMAFQFSGTALDVAIQQREEGAEDALPALSEAAALNVSDAEPGQDNQPAPEAPAPEIVEQTPALPPQPPPAVAEREASPSPAEVFEPQVRQRSRPARGVRLMPTKRSRTATPEEFHPELQAFVTRWKPFLTETQLAICTYIFNNSLAVGEEYCFTSTAKLMDAVSKTERQVKTVLNQLLDWGFLLKGETVVNAPRENRGTYYKLAIDKS